LTTDSLGDVYPVFSSPSCPGLQDINENERSSKKREIQQVKRATGVKGEMEKEMR